MTLKKSKIVYSVAWNLVLLLIGAIVVAVGIKAVAIPNGFITGNTFSVIGKGFSRRKLY